MRGDLSDRLLTYDKDHCFQKEQRIQNAEEDLRALGMSAEQAQKIRISDMSFEHVPSDRKDACAYVRDFIVRHEWLGTLPQRPTHRFVAVYQDASGYRHLAGVLVMATPNTFANLLGSSSRDLEKLVARGASISWAPKNLGSWLIMNSVNWMVKNTDYRIFTAYSDPEARELGTVYQACNWFYLGRTSKAKQYRDPQNPDLGWFSEREFRKKHRRLKEARAYGRADELARYFTGPFKYTPDWASMPEDLIEQVKAAERAHRARCETRWTKPKHKYALIRGASKKETKELLKRFKEMHPEIWEKRFEYPRERGR